MKSALSVLILFVLISPFAFAQTGRGMLIAPVKAEMAKPKVESAKRIKTSRGTVPAKATAYLSVPHINYF